MARLTVLGVHAGGCFVHVGDGKEMGVTHVLAQRVVWIRCMGGVVRCGGRMCGRKGGKEIGVDRGSGGEWE
eukprot:7402918-Prorocentrum_lima.AAC.1